MNVSHQRVQVLIRGAGSASQSSRAVSVSSDIGGYAEWEVAYGLSNEILSLSRNLAHMCTLQMVQTWLRSGAGVNVLIKPSLVLKKLLSFHPRAHSAGTVVSGQETEATLLFLHILYQQFLATVSAEKAMSLCESYESSLLKRLHWQDQQSLNCRCMKQQHAAGRCNDPSIFAHAAGTIIA